MRTRVNPLARSVPFGNSLLYNSGCRFLVCSTLLAAMLMSCHLYAQDGAASIPIGDASLTPKVEIEYTSTDNAFLTEENLTSSYGVVVRPDVSLSADTRLSRLQMDYSGAYASFDESRLDYTDHNLGISGSQGIGKRLTLGAGLRLKYQHQQLGNGFTIENAEDFSEQPTFRSYEAGARLTYGAVDAKGNLHFGVRLRDRAATNLESDTRVSDFSSVKPFAEFSLRVSPVTRAFVRFEYSDVDYDRGITRDREVLSALIGLSLAATGKLSGTVEVGLSDVNNTDPQIRDSEVLVVQGTLRYQPVDYSTFDLVFRRNPDVELLTFETLDEDTDSETITNRIRLSWVHEWSSRFYHEAGVGFYSIDRECTEGSSYETVGGDFYLNLLVSRWLTLRAGLLDDQRKNICDDDPRDIDYDRQKFVVGLKATL